MENTRIRQTIILLTIVNALGCATDLLFFYYSVSYTYMIVTLAGMPGFSGVGYAIGNDSKYMCDGIVPCSHFICEGFYKYLPPNVTNCGAGDDDFIERSGTAETIALLDYFTILMVVHLIVSVVTLTAYGLTLRKQSKKLIIAACAGLCIMFMLTSAATKILPVIILLKASTTYAELPVFIFASDMLERKYIYSIVVGVALLSNFANIYISYPNERESISPQETLFFAGGTSDDHRGSDIDDTE